MNLCLLQQGVSKELELFPHILEFALKRNNSIQLNSFTESSAECIRFYYVIDGKFEWIIQQEHYVLYPSDFAIILPGQTLRAEKDYLDIGTLRWLYLEPNNSDTETKMLPGKWSNISGREIIPIKKVLMLNTIPVVSKFREAGVVMQNLQIELFGQELGYSTRVNQLMDELFILITRQLTKQNNSYRDFPQTFLRLEETLRQNLSHQWTVEEMAALVGLGSTAFTEKVKKFTGFSPLNYLINIRISEAIKLLKKQNENVTNVALETGFYSSQHFSTTFKKLTGYTPSQFKKSNIS
ncbi:MAG TPA: AraC family transcriptional regulator [Chitinophagaceae bacterium]|jgi:AraC-like DNA-binding protein|nr:AraC family transcriptional regulator [Chitinophagaceae bacterium]